MRGAICWICCGVSNITPAGAVLNSGLVGLAEWHTAQRSWITPWTLSKSIEAWAGAASAGAGAGAAGAAGLSPPPNAVSGSGWYSMAAGALATSGAVATGFGPVTYARQIIASAPTGRVQAYF